MKLADICKKLASNNLVFVMMKLIYSLDFFLVEGANSYVFSDILTHKIFAYKIHYNMVNDNIDLKSHI